MEKISLNRVSTLMVLALSGIVLTYSSCKKDDSGKGAPVISDVRAYAATPGDSILKSAKPGQYILLQGSNLSGVTAVYFDGTKATINAALASDNNFPVTIPTIPFGSVTSAQFNTIVVVSSGGQTTYKFPIAAPEPYISTISNEMPNAGDVITLSGTGLFAVTNIVFPGNIAATTYSSSASGDTTTVTVPSGVTATGSIVVTTKYGTSTSALNTELNDNADVFLNFDDKDGFTPWSNLPVVVSSVASPAIASDRGNFLYWNSQNVTAGTYYDGDLATPTDGSQLAYPSTISTSEPAANLAIKFEANIPVAMSAGIVEFEFNYGDEYNWDPWLINGSTTVPVQTSGWHNFTIPLSSFPGVSTYNDIKGQPLELFYINGNGPTQNVNIGWDNFRVVKIK